MLSLLLFQPKVKQFKRFDPALNLPESITAHADGCLYVSLERGFVLRVRCDHDIEPIAMLPLPPDTVATGIKAGRDGNLYVASGRRPGTPAAAPFHRDTAAVWRVSLENGGVKKFATLDVHGFPNDLAFDGKDNLFVTDSWLGRLWKISKDGAASDFLTDPCLKGDEDKPSREGPPFGINGIAFGPDGHTIYVCNQDLGSVYAIPNQANPPLQPFVVKHPLLMGPDGIAFDTEGTLHAAVLKQNQLVRVDRHGQVARLAQNAPLQSPSSVAFGTANADRHTLFVANFSIYQKLGGADPKDLNPGILSLRVQKPGLPLLL
jgi:sugar lactone lactonase YvrE